MEESDAKLRALQKTLDESTADGGSFSDDEIAAAIEAKAAELARQGY